MIILEQNFVVEIVGTYNLINVVSPLVESEPDTDLCERDS